MSVRIDPSWRRIMSRNVRTFSGHVLTQVEQVIIKTAEKIAGLAASLAPVDEGNLKNSIQIDYKNNGLTAEITVGAEYAIYVEYGTGIYAVDGNGRKTPWTYYSPKLGRYVRTQGAPAQPFFWPAVEEGGDYFEREMRRLKG